jgi:transcriptional regulator with XRE-family HTH domain
MENKTDGDLLREARLNAGLSLQALADKAGLKWAAVQAMEAGRYGGTFQAKGKLALALGIPVKELFPMAYREISELLVSFGGKIEKTKSEKRVEKKK